jgi:PAS domain-containing protein
MTPHLSLSQLSFLVGTAVVIGVVLVLIVIGLHKVFARQRQGITPVPGTPRAEEATAFGLAALQGVIATLKEQQQELQERCRAAEGRAEMNTRTMETILQGMDQGVLVFDREGFISMTNHAARALLGVDTWSRRRYPEVLGPESQMTGLVWECLQRGAIARQQTLEYHTPHGGVVSLAVSVLPLQGRNGGIEGAVCLLGRIGGAGDGILAAPLNAQDQG